MEEKDLKYLTEHLENVIEEKVNGKIENLKQRLDERFNAHEEQMQPIYDAYLSASTAGKFIVWTGKIIVAIGIVIAAIVAAFSFFNMR